MKTILVADDLACARILHTHLLVQLGHRVVTAADGVEALRILQSQPVDVVVLDMLMPRMDGHEFLRRMRAMPGYATVPVLVVTSEGDRHHEETLRAAGATAFLRKPAHPDAMQDLIRSLTH
jgi:two-component system chemotaxis response regulator CheY